MPPIREGVRTKDEILADNVVGVINYAIDVKGQRRSTVINQLEKRYPDATRRSIEAAYDHVIAARAAGRAQNRRDEDETLTRAQTPRNPNLPSNWRYVVQVSWVDPHTKSVVYRTVIIDSQRPLSSGDIADQAHSQLGMSHSTRSRRVPGYERLSVTREEIDARVISVERR